MTNKLPEVGKRYIFKLYEIEHPEIIVIAITKSFIVYLVKCKYGLERDVKHCGKNVFFDYYEELPKDDSNLTINESLSN